MDDDAIGVPVFRVPVRFFLFFSFYFFTSLFPPDLSLTVSGIGWIFTLLTYFFKIRAVEGDQIAIFGLLGIQTSTMDAAMPPTSFQVRILFRRFLLLLFQLSFHFKYYQGLGFCN